MRLFIVTTFLFLSSFLFGQITFEEITAPSDFSLRSIYKSPTGEYFLQSVNDFENIYSSTDGVNWLKQPLPSNIALTNVQFYDDGTPLFGTSTRCIRRNGEWYTLPSNVEAADIDNETLYVLTSNDVFRTSNDKGLTFEDYFSIDPTTIWNPNNIYVLGNNIAIHHAAGATDYVSVFNPSGTMLLDEELQGGIIDVYKSGCNNLLMVDYDEYYLLTENLAFTQGNTVDILPVDANLNDNFVSNGTDFFLYYENGLYKINGCDFSSELVAENNNNLSFELYFLSVSKNEDFLLYSLYYDFFFEQSNGSSEFQLQTISANNPTILSVDESNDGYMAISTYNNIFTKNLADPDWTDFGNLGNNNFFRFLDYSPNSNLYASKIDELFFSENNGLDFTTLNLPQTFLTPNVRSVIDDGVLFATSLIEDTYSVDNGETWIPLDNGQGISDYFVGKLVGNILMIYYYDDFLINTQLVLININTNVQTSFELPPANINEIYDAAITNDGVLYLMGSNWQSALGQGVINKYEIGGVMEEVGVFPELEGINDIIASGKSIFAFGPNFYYELYDDQLTMYTHEGLPTGGSRNFKIAENEHIYAIVDNNRLFRTTTPLSFEANLLGKVSYDVNENCMTDTNEIGLSDWKITVEGDDFLRIKQTNDEGIARINLPEGEYTISATPISFGWGLCEYSHDVVVDLSNPNPPLQDFYAQALVECAGLTVDFSTPLLRRCFDNYYQIVIHNGGPLTSQDTKLTLQLDPFFDFQSADLPYTTNSAGDLEFELGQLGLNEEISFRIYFNLSCDAELSAEHCLTGLLTDPIICNNTLAVGSYTECQENIGSYDPNDKRVFNEAGRETMLIDTSEFIYYHIRFQNTGTDTAFTVKVVDELSEKLDISTFEMLSASHDYEYTIRTGSILEVNFDNILLPDSTTNEVASHGFFKFKIKPLSEYEYGTEISNKASIFFDFNDPIVTNAAIFELGKPVSTFDIPNLIDLKIFPNPANSQVSYDASNDLFDKVDQLEVVNSFGQIVLINNSITNNIIDISHLPAGYYTLILSATNERIGVGKFAVIR